MSVIIRKSGFFKKDWCYDEEKDHGEYREKYIHGFDIFSLWHEEFEAFDYITLKEFVDYLNDPVRDGIMAMIQLLTGCDIKPFIHELSEEPTVDDRMDKIVIEQVMGLDQYKGDEFFTAECYTAAHGLKNGDDTTWSISWNNWANLKDAQLVFQPKIRMCISKQPGDYDLYDVDFKPTLGEIIQGLFHELTWCCTPEKRAMNMDEIMRRKEEIDSGEAELIELDLDKFFEEIEDE